MKHIISRKGKTVLGAVIFLLIIGIALLIFIEKSFQNDDYQASLAKISKQRFSYQVTAIDPRVNPQEGAPGTDFSFVTRLKCEVKKEGRVIPCKDNNPPVIIKNVIAKIRSNGQEVYTMKLVNSTTNVYRGVIQSDDFESGIHWVSLHIIDQTGKLTTLNDIASFNVTGSDEGELVINFTGPPANDVPINGKDVEFLTLGFTPDVDIEILRLSLTIEAATSDATAAGGLIDTSGATPMANFTDIKMTDADTGEILMRPQELITFHSDVSQTINFADNFTVDANETRNVTVTMDIRNNTALNAMGARVKLEAVKTTDVKNRKTGNAIAEVQPDSAIMGNTMNIFAPSMEISLTNTALVSDSVNVAGTAGILAARFNAKASGEDYVIKAMNFEIENLSSGATEEIESLYISYPTESGAMQSFPKVTPVSEYGKKLAYLDWASKDYDIPPPDFYVSTARDNIFEVYVDANGLNEKALSGSRIRVSFDATDTTAVFKAVGQTTTAVIVDDVTQNDADLNNGNAVILYKSLPYFAQNTTSPGCPKDKGFLEQGIQNLYCFDITADVSGTIDLYKMIPLIIPMGGVTVDADASGYAVALYDHDDQTTPIAKAKNINGFMANFTMESGYKINSAATKTFIIKALNIRYDAGTKSAVSTLLTRDSFYDEPKAAYNINAYTIWSDMSSSNHSTSTPDWTNSYKLQGLPTNGIYLSN